MLPETLLVPTNSYLAFGARRRTREAAHRGAEGSFGHVPPHPQPALLLSDHPCANDARQGATIQHPGWAAKHVGFMPFPVDRSNRDRP